MQKIKFIPVITILRGLAALMVCLFHFVVTTTGYVQNEFVLTIFDVGGVGVQMFFVISGIVLPLSMINGGYTYKFWWTFLKKRLLRIEPPYLIAVILSIVYLTLRNYMPNTVPLEFDLTFKNLFAHLGYLVPFFDDVKWFNPVFWTLAIEFQFYLLLMLLFPLINYGLLWRVCLYLIILLPGLYFSEFFFQYGNLFLLGIAYILYKGDKISKIEFSVLFFITNLFILHILGVRGFSVGIFTIAIVHYFPYLKNKYLEFLGKISYSLYLTHTLTGSALINVLTHSFTESWQKPIVIFIGLIFSLITAYIFYLIFEKPFQKKASKLKYQDNIEKSKTDEFEKVYVLK